MASGVTDRDLGYADLKAKIALLDGVELTVGIHEGLEGDGGEGIATYAAANEYGTDTIPARPFMRTAADENTDKWLQRTERQIAKCTRPNGPSPAKALVSVGNIMRNDIVNSIKSGDWEPNAAATIERKGSSKPLVDTGAMQRAITVKIEGA